MPRIIVTVGSREPMTVRVLPATPLGTLGPEGEVTVGQLILRGNPTALRVLADWLQEAADLAEYEPPAQRALDSE